MELNHGIISYSTSLSFGRSKKTHCTNLCINSINARAMPPKKPRVSAADPEIRKDGPLKSSKRRSTGRAKGGKQAAPQQQNDQPAEPPAQRPVAPRLPPEILQKIVDFVLPPCPATNKPGSHFAHLENDENAACSCPRGVSVLVPLLSVSWDWFSAAVPRIYSHLPVTSLVTSIDDEESGTESNNSSDDMGPGHMLRFGRALDSPTRGHLYASAVRQLEFSGFLCTCVVNKLCEHIQTFVNLDRLLLVSLDAEDPAAYTAKIMRAARDLPLRSLEIGALKLLPAASVFGPCLATWKHLEVLLMPLKNHWIVDDPCEALSNYTPKSVREICFTSSGSADQVNRLLKRVPNLEKLAADLPSWAPAKAFKFLPKASKKLTKLQIQLIDDRTSEGSTPLNPPPTLLQGIATKSLDTLRLRRFRFENDASAELLSLAKENPGVQRVNFHQCQFHETILPDVMACFRDLRELTVVSSHAGVQLAAALSKCHDLHLLFLVGEFIDAASFSAIATMQHLEKLSVSSSEYNFEDLLRACKTCPSLKTVTVSMQQWRSAELLRAECPALQVLLDHERTDIAEQGIHAPMGLPFGPMGIGFGIGLPFGGFLNLFDWADMMFGMAGDDDDDELEENDGGLGEA